MTTRADLERAIDDDPEDDARRLVLADWLQQRGDPLGELAVVQHHGVRPDGELLARALGELAPFVEHLQPAWRGGFLDGVRFSDWEHIADCAPEDVDDFDLLALVRLVCAHPVARFLRTVKIGLTTYDAVPRYDQGILAVLGELALELRALRSLELGALDYEHGEMELSWVALGDVGALVRRFGPQLHELRIAGACVHMEDVRLELGGLELPALRRFALRTTDLRRDVLRSILDARWPELAALRLWFGDPDRGCEITPDDVEPLLATPLPLAELGLGNCAFTDELIEPLALSDVLPRLRVLDLSAGTLTDEGAETLLEHAQAFAHLDRLVIDRCHLSDTAARAVATICTQVSVSDQRELLGGERFVAVHE